MIFLTVTILCLQANNMAPVNCASFTSPPFKTKKECEKYRSEFGITDKCSKYWVNEQKKPVEDTAWIN